MVYPEPNMAVSTFMKPDGSLGTVQEEPPDEKDTDYRYSNQDRAK